MTPEEEQAFKALQAKLELAHEELEFASGQLRELGATVSSLDRRTAQNLHRLSAAEGDLERNAVRLHKLQRSRRFTNILLTAGSVLAGLSLATATAQLDWWRVWSWISDAGVFLKLVSLGCLVCLGRGLYWLRENRPRIYGWSEITVGIATCAAVLWTRDPSPVQVGLRLMAGVYLMVRGHDNRIAGYNRLMTRRAVSVPSEGAQR